MTVDILTPTYVGLPGSDGSLGIMNNHAALVTTLQAGQVVVRTSGGDQTFDVKGGSVEVLNNVVTVLAE